tara:strand:+ start:57333 stop:58130 length:798 start_codon:yes stop_codon:yes gene_type:complete
MVKKSNGWENLTFQEKLKIYSKSLNETDAFYADKLRVKNFVNDLKIKNLNVVPNVKVLTKNDHLDLDDLPENCIIKSNNGCGDLIIIKNRKINYVSIRANELDPIKFNWQNWKQYANRPHTTKSEHHYKYIKPEIYAEELLPNKPEDYKFFCFHGFVKFGHTDYGRFAEHTRNIYDRNGSLLPITAIFGRHHFKNNNIELDKPKFLEMVKIADKLSSATKYEFIRVDLYNVNNQVYFGELTFVPGGGDEHFQPSEFDKIAGKYWK